MTHNPVFTSSAKRRMRSYRSPLLISLYGIFLLIVSTGALSMLQRQELFIGNLRIGLETYIYLVVMQFFLIVFVAPALAAGSISGERERQTLDMLLSTRVSSFKIVIGKMFSTLCFLALMVFSSLPAMAITLFFGGVSFVDMLLSLVFLIVCAFACLAIGTFCSALFKRSVTATVVAYLIVFALGIGTLAFPILFQQTALNKAIDLTYQAINPVSSQIGTATVQVVTMQTVLTALPKSLLVNPLVGLFTILVRQTGLLQRTLTDYASNFSYSLGRMYTLIEYSDIMIYINMGFMAVTGTVLTLFSSVLIKPAGRKARKKK